MNFNCPKCNQPIQVDDSYAGQAGNCPSCGEAVTIPAPSSPVLQPAAASIAQNATVTVTTKNTTALTMGIIAIVLGVLSLLVAWIPFLGLIAIPVAAIGGFLALIGLVLAALKKFRGWAMPLLGGIICVIAIVVSMSSTGSTSVAIAETMEDASKAIEESSTATKSAEVKSDAAEKEYIANQIELYDVEAKYRNSLLDGKVPGVLFKLKNNGDKTLNKVKITCYFLNADGKRIAEEDYFPVSVSDFSFGNNNKPLKPGYVWSMEKNKFYSAKSVPSEWKEGAIEIEISEIQFADVAQ